MELDESQWRQIDALLAEGRKIEAIKLYREFTGVGLKEAKDAIEARFQAPAGASVGGGFGGLTDAQWRQIDAELLAGRKIAAIKLYREFTGADLKSAKEAMDARDDELRGRNPRQHPPDRKGGCLSVLLLPLLAPITYLLKLLLS